MNQWRRRCVSKRDRSSVQTPNFKDTTMTAATIEQARPTARLLARAIGIASIGSALATSVIAFVAHAAGVSDDFDPIAPSAFLTLAVIGVGFAALSWFAIARRTANPRTILTRLVPAVVLISFIPDLLLGVSQSEPGTTWGAVAWLMLMHLAVAAITVPTLARVIPVRDAN
jgi:hypothetical protein